MPRLAIVVLACAVGACAPARRAWVPREPAPGDAPAAYAVVHAATPLHVAPDRRAATVRLPAEGFVPVRILRERDGWAHLETLGEPGTAHCAPGLARLDPFRLRLYAPTATLVPVTAREVTQTFTDDTSVHLSRGVPLERVSDRLFRAHLDGASLVVRVERQDVGTRYLPSPRIERAPTGRELSADALRSSVPILGMTGRLTGTEALPVHARHERGGESVVEVRPRCARVRVRVPSHAVADVEPADLLLMGAAISTPIVEPGSTVYWANAQPAGVVTSSVHLADEIEPVEGRRCFRYPLDARRTTVVILCFAPRDVVEPGAGPARRLDPPG